MVDAANLGALQALLFQVHFRRMGLSLFVGWLVRGLWLQDGIGVVLWALDGVADDWQSADVLAVSCTDSENTVPHGCRERPMMPCSRRALSCRCAGSD